MMRTTCIGVLILVFMSACEKENDNRDDLTSGFVGTFYYDEDFSDIADTLVIERIDDKTLLINNFQNLPGFEATTTVSSSQDWPAIDLNIQEQSLSFNGTTIHVEGSDRWEDRPEVHGLIIKYEACDNNRPCLSLSLTILVDGERYYFNGLSPL